MKAFQKSKTTFLFGGALLCLLSSGCEWFLYDRARPLQDFAFYSMELDKPPLVDDLEKLKIFEGDTVRLVGKYKQMNVNQKPGAEPIYVGRIHIELKDKTHVFLETDVKGIRSKDEIERFERKKIIVTGVVSTGCIGWGDGEEATLSGPCIQNLGKIEHYK